ncbi:MAG: hypothetical protein HZA32_05760 [Opitutae bacterium]|nr:hypothetical protein [Opitutae bacterium]
MPRILSALVLAITLALLSGCATYSPVGLAPQIESALPGASIANTDRPAVDLFVYSTSDATFGILGGAIGGALSAGMGDKAVNDELRAAGVVFPNELLRTRLLERLRTKHQVTALGSEGVALDAEKRGFAPAASTTSARYILDTDAGWMCSYLPLNWGRYQFQIFFSVRLLDRATGKVLFDERYLWRTPKELGYPSRKEFTTDEQKGVKAQLAAAVAAAEAHFAEKLKL